MHALSGCSGEADGPAEIVGCMDENAENYDENATLEAPAHTRIPMVMEYLTSTKFQCTDNALTTSFQRPPMMMGAVIIGFLNIPKHGPSTTRKMRTVCAQTGPSTILFT